MILYRFWQALHKVWRRCRLTDDRVRLKFASLNDTDIYPCEASLSRDLPRLLWIRCPINRQSARRLYALSRLRW